ncbi:MAG: surface layer protein [Ruminococcaceae bacterium]|nr:surface layer protein [Oscillospiraceae bacterium]
MKKLLVPTALALALVLTLALIPAALASDGAPVAKNLEIDTYRGVSVGGRLSASDPEGGDVTYRITTAPIKGSIDLDDDGHFVYTPEDGKRGKDYFGYKAIDCDGNESQEATVIIRIQKQKGKVNYSDLKGDSCGSAAVRLAEEGVFVGECLAGEYVFSPDTPVTRAEFLAMCMLVSGTEKPGNVRTTGFSDDADIAAWAKPYVSSALKKGIISGYATDGAGAVFCPERSISVAEAAVILDRSVELTGAVAVWFSPDGAVPAWAMQSAANVSSSGLLPYGCSFAADTLTRAQAAQMLCAALDNIKSR